MKILDQLDDHFGESIELDDDSRKAISEYLKSNSAEFSLAKRAVKIMRSLGAMAEYRICAVLFWKPRQCANQLHALCKPDIDDIVLEL